MNIKESVTAFCGVEVPGATVDLELINAGMDGAAEYSAGLEIQTARAAANVLASILPLASFKEGDLTIQVSTEGIKIRLAWLAKKYGFDDVLEVAKPTVRDKSHVW